MNYQEARRVRNTGLFNLAAQNIASGGGIGSSLGSAISSKFKAKITGIKEKFDPLNIAKKLTGNFGAAVLGKITGRSQRDIQYFAGGKGYGSSSGVTQESNLDAIQPALYTKVKEGQKQRMKKGDSVSDVLARLYNLTKNNYDAEEKRRDKEIRDKYKENERNQKWHEELLDAILGPNRFKKEKEKTTKKKGSGIFDFINNLQNKFNNFIEGLENKIKEGAEKAIEKKVAKTALKTAAEAAAEKAAAEAASKTAGTATAEAAGQTAIKEISESTIKQAAKPSVEKLVVKAGSKSIPLIGGLIGTAFAVPRMLKGDFVGAGLEIASGVGGISTSVAGGLLLAARDVYNEVYKNPETGVLANLENDLVTDYDGTKERLTKITNVIDTLINESLKQRKSDTAKAAEMNKPVVTENGGGAAFLSRGSRSNRGTGKATKVNPIESGSTETATKASMVNNNQSNSSVANNVNQSNSSVANNVNQSNSSVANNVNQSNSSMVNNNQSNSSVANNVNQSNSSVANNNQSNSSMVNNNQSSMVNNNQSSMVNNNQSNSSVANNNQSSMVNNNQSSSNMVNNVNQSSSNMVNNANQSNSSMVNKTTTNMPSATMTPPAPNPLTERVVSSINENNNLQIEKSQPKIVTIDKSKNINVASKDNSPSLILDSSVNVRSDDPTLQKTQRQNLRPV